VLGGPGRRQDHRLVRALAGDLDAVPEGDVV
jgi:hypothetical protein